MPCLLLSIDRGQYKFPTGVPGKGNDVEPQLDFWRQLVWYMFENTLMKIQRLWGLMEDG